MTHYTLSRQAKNAVNAQYCLLRERASTFIKSINLLKKMGYIALKILKAHHSQLRIAFTSQSA